MSIRPLQFPADLVPLSKMLPESFQYPENDTWSVQEDEKEALVSTMHNLIRLWPLIKILQFISPTLRDALRGFAWMEGEELVGATMTQRRGSTDFWEVGTVGVLPAYRRRGIARALVGKTLDFIRERGGRKIYLDVIDGNLPAHTLYQSLGFEDFSGGVELYTFPEKGLKPVPLPGGYLGNPADCYDWRARYELEKRVTPESVTRFEPVEIERYRLSPMMQVLGRLLSAAEGKREHCLSIQTGDGGLTAALARYSVSKRGKGVNHLRVIADPDHPDLAPSLIDHLLQQVSGVSPGLRTEIIVPSWMTDVVSAAEKAGFTRRVEYIRMGLFL